MWIDTTSIWLYRATLIDRGKSMSTELHEALDSGLGQLLRLRGVLDSAGVASGLGVSLSEALALRDLRDGPAQQNALGAVLGLEKSTVSRLVDGLIAKGWVTRERDPGNGRVRSVVITPRGLAEEQRVAAAMRERHARVFAALTAREREAVSIALPALARALAEVPS